MIIALPDRSPSIPLDLLETLAQRIAFREGKPWGSLNWQEQQTFIWDAERRLRGAMGVRAEADGHPSEAPSTIRDVILLHYLLQSSADWHSIAAGMLRSEARHLGEAMGF